jgi:hypothetical protein
VPAFPSLKLDHSFWFAVQSLSLVNLSQYSLTLTSHSIGKKHSTRMASPALPLAVRAWTHIRAGTSVLTLSPSVPLPTISSPNHVLVQVTHAALNPGASIMMQLYPFVFRSRGVPEPDFSGRIIAAGSGVAATRNLRLALRFLDL